MSKVFTAEEVAKHNNEKDLWLVYQNSVYDLTKFLKEHPGGEEVLLVLAGQDGTKCFDEIGHSGEAIDLRETYKIGTVVGPVSGPTSGHNGVQDTTTIDDDHWEYQELKYDSSSSLPIIITIGVMVYAFLFYYFWFS